MIRLILAVVLTLATPAVAAASGKSATKLEGLREWDTSRATSTKLLGELKADPARGKAVEALEREWKTLDRKMQKVRELQTQGKLDAKTARATADDLAAQVKRVESAQEEIRNKRSMDTTAFQNFDQKSNQLMNMLTSVVKTMNELRGIGAGSRSGL